MLRCRHAKVVSDSSIDVNASTDLPSALTRWFAINKRAMPWRNTRDPYSIWLSEVMLQQTQVATVIAYYERFIKRFPTVHALAAGDLDEVLKLWAGLGYYSRARCLHRGAQVIVTDFGGRMPETLEQIRRIPSIGPYTAGAVLSIAHGKPEALVDGNVARVLSRIKLIGGDWRQSATKAKLWELARALHLEALEKKIDPGDLNQALMELGATVCTPRGPLCGQCPAQKQCGAFREDKQSEFPETTKKTAVTTLRLLSWIVSDSKGRVLLAQRESGGLFGGLWEVPTATRAPGKEKRGTPAGSFRHLLSHRELKIQASAVDKKLWTESIEPEFNCWSGKYVNWRWVLPREAIDGAVALASIQKKILQK